MARDGLGVGWAVLSRTWERTARTIALSASRLRDDPETVKWAAFTLIGGAGIGLLVAR